MTKSKKPVEIWDQEFAHWHVLGPILWAVVAYIGAGVLHELETPVKYVVLTGIAASGLAPLAAPIHKRWSFALIASTAALLTWTTVTTPWQWPPVWGALGGSVVFGMSYQALRIREEKQADADKTAEQAAKKGRYVDLLETIGVKGLKESGRTMFEAGKTITLLLPVTGKVTLARLKDVTESLTIAAARGGLTGVTFEFEAGDSPAEIKLHVFDRDILAEEVPLPFDRGPKSITQPIPLGVYPTGEVCVVTFRQVAALLVGLKGRGKSGLIHTHLAHLTGCTDAVVWMLDGKGGETVYPWLQPFLDMVTDKPAINWAASTQAEFDAVLLAAKAVVTYRTGEAKRSGRLWPKPSTAAPAVIVIVEEASVITGVSRYGNGNRVEMAQDGVTLGRSSAVDWLFATQRATLDMLGSGSMKSNMDLRYGMGVTEAQDARMIFPDGNIAKSLFRLGTDEKYRGTFLMQAPGVNRVMPAKGYWIDTETIPGIATTNAQWVAELDHETADYVHQVLIDAGVSGGYYGRWDRLAGRSTERVSDRVTRPAETVQQDETPRVMGPAAQAVQDSIAASRAKRDDDTFQALVSQFETLEIDEDDIRLRDVSQLPAGVPPILGMVLAIFRGRDADGLPSKLIAEELNITQKTLGRLMGHCNVSTGEEVIWEDKRARGYTRDAIETSVKRGSWTQAAFDWQP